MQWNRFRIFTSATEDDEQRVTVAGSPPTAPPPSTCRWIVVEIMWGLHDEDVGVNYVKSTSLTIHATFSSETR